MGTVYKPTYPKPMPAGAELFTKRPGDPEAEPEKWARWTDGKGRKRRAKVSADGHKVLIESRTWHAKYRDGAGHVHTVPTRCRQQDMARQVLADLERRAERVRAGTVTAAEVRTADHAAAPIGEHLDAYEAHLRGVCTSSGHLRTALPRVRRLVAACGFKALADVEQGAVDRWLGTREASNLAPQTRLAYVVGLRAFMAWALQTGRVAVNPLAGMKRPGVHEQKRPRRALTAGELARLIEAARIRPLAEYGRLTVKLPTREGKRSSWTYARLTPENLQTCERRARERLADKPGLLSKLEAEGAARALIYKALALTALRLSELRSLTVAAVSDLDGSEPYAILRAADEKARRGAEIPLRADLAKDLSRHLAERLRVQRRACMAASRPVPVALAASEPLIGLNMESLVKRLNLDLTAAGIDKTDSRKRTADVHCLRTTFNSLLAAAGVPLTTRRILMRHAAAGITDEHYTDRALIDLRGALDLLPALPLDGCPEAERSRANGTDDTVEVSRAQHAPRHAPATGKTCQNGALPYKTAENRRESETIVSGCRDKDLQREAKTTKSHRGGLEPPTFGSVDRCSIQLS